MRHGRLRGGVVALVLGALANACSLALDFDRFDRGLGAAPAGADAEPADAASRDAARDGAADIAAGGDGESAADAQKDASPDDAPTCPSAACTALAACCATLPEPALTKCFDQYYLRRPDETRCCNFLLTLRSSGACP